MSYVSEYLKAVKKMEEDRKKYQASKPAESRTPVSPIKNYWDQNADLKNVNVITVDDDIAPVIASVTNRMTTKAKETLSNKKKDDKWYHGWFQKGALEDEQKASNISKAILGTSTDVVQDLTTGVVSMPEKALDALMLIAPYSVLSSSPYTSASILQNQSKVFEEAKKSSAEFVMKDLYDEKAVANKLLSDMYGNFNNLQKLQNGQYLTEEDLKRAMAESAVAKNYLDNEMESDSLLGEKSDSIVQSGGQMLATAALNGIVPWWLTTGLTAFGGEAENALDQGATHEEALISSTISAGAEILSEKIFGGIKFGGKALDDALTQQIARGVSNKFIRNALKFGLDAFGEGAEEVLTEGLNKFGQWLSYKSEEELKNLLFSEESIDEYIQAFFGGAAMGGVSNVSNVAKSSVEGVDAVSGLTKNEEAVVRKVYDTMVAEEVERNGKVSKAKKTEIYNNVLNQLEKGYITTDTIEEVLGGESYNNYRSTVAGEDNIIKEFEELGKKEHPTLSETSRYKELEQKVKDIKSKDLRTELKSKLSNEVFGLVKDSRLAESYNEKARRSQKFEADLSKYDLQQQKTIQNAIDSGVLNNTNKTHDMVELIAKISADKNVPFDFANNSKIKESGFAIEGKIVNGYKTADGITINVESPKYLQSTVGHEITHVLEGTELYDSLKETIFNYAISKEGLDSFNARLKAVEEMYKDIDGADFEGELAADLVGDYLFQDADFVNRLSAENRNIFEKIFDEIKYLCKVATAGSKEARELERVKKLFEDAYRANVNGKVDTQYSISYTTDNRPVATIESDIFNGKFEELTESERVKIVKNAIKEFRPGVPVSGRLIGITRKSAEHFTNSDYTDNLRNNDKQLYEDKLNIAQNIDDVVYASTDYINEELKHPRKDNIEQFARGTVLLDIGGNKYEASVLVGYTSMRQMVLYDVQDLTPVSFETKKKMQPTLAGNESDTRKTVASSFATKVAQNGEDVKHSLFDSTGMELTKDQQDYFKDFTEKTQITDEQNEHGLDRENEVQFSLSRDTEYMDKAIAQNDSLKFVAPEKMNYAKALRERIATRMNDIKDRGLVGLPEDIEGNTYIANSSYDGTEENTTICPRSLASEAFVDAVSEYLGRPLTVEEQIYISQDLQGRSLTPECTYCYVATDRKAYRAFLGEYISQRDAVLEKVKNNPNADVSKNGELYKEFLNGRKDTAPMYNRFKMWVDAYKYGKPMVNASHLANINKLMGDINSEFGAELKPQIADAMKYAQSASWAKKRVNYVAYNGHILKWKQDRINKLNSHYGLRMYSFSDFHPAFVLENMQMITDASVRGLKMLGYTKDTDFVEIFAPSGMNINVSTFGFETDGNVYENNIIGAEWDKAKALREQYPNVGITFVATNDQLVNWALEQDWIDVVIPYHLVRTGTEVAKTFGYTNYTSESSDTKTKEWTKGDKKYIAPTEHNNDKATYFDALDKNHLNPRFERFKDNPNYMKLVNECRQSASESKPVQPVFNEDAAKVALAKLEANGYYQPIGGSVDRMYEIAAEVAEDMQSKLAPTQHSLSDETSVNRRYGEYATPANELAYEEIAPVANAVAEDVAQETVTQETPVQETKRPETRKELHQDIVDKIKSTFNAKGFDFDEVLKKAKNLSTFATVDNTPQRVMEKALGYKEGNVLADITVNKVAQNESEGIKWLNSFTNRKNGLLAQLSKQYNIKPGSKESAAAQMYAEGFYVDSNNDIVKYGDAELAADFKNEKVRENIKRLARDPRIRKVYDETLARINESRTRNAYPEIPRLDNYFLHFRAMEDTFSRLGLPFNPNDIRAKDLPTDLNGVTADLKPGQPYFASAMHREGKRTSFDLLGGMERYLTSAKNQIYHIEDIQTLRALRNYIADTYGRASGLEDLDSLSDAEAEERIKQVYGSHLSTFAKFLNEEANVLAGKTALIDRGLEGIIGRRGITFLNTVNQQVGANMVGWNISSSLTNFLPVAQTFAKTNKFDFVKAFAQTAANKISGGKLDTFTEDSPVVIRRKGADRFYRTPWQKLSDPGYILMSAVDDISTELIARTKYNELTRKGMDSQQAHYETDKWVSRLMGDRSLGQMPQLYNSKMLGLVTKFQLEVRNQLDSQFYDTIQETKASNEDIKNGLLRNAKTAANVTSTFVQLAVVQHLFGKAFESVAGYNPAFDIIEVLMTAFGFDDEEESEDTVLDNIEQGFFALLEDLPYASTFTGGGRIPISSALPIKELVKGEDQYGNDKSRWETLGEIAPYYLLPGGYGQAKKTVQGLGMFSDEHPIAGSYTDSGNLRFTVEDNLKTRLKAAIFGQYASENARKYFDEEQKPLTPEQTKILAALDVPVEKYWEYKENLDAFYDKKNSAKEAANKDNATAEDILKSRYISSVSSEISNLTEKQKELANGNSQNKQAQIKDIQNQIVSLLDDADSALENVSLRGNYAEIGNRRYNYDANKDTWYEIKPKTSDGSTNKYYEKEQKVTKTLNISYEEYWNNKEEYDFAYENPAKYSLAKAVGGYDAYRNYTAYLSTLKADKDAYGNSIDGTKKAKVYDYIFNQLDIDYGEKIILYRSMYSSNADKNAYNYDIVMYLLDRDDISYKEMESILNSLDITIDSNYNFIW